MLHFNDSTQDIRIVGCARNKGNTGYAAEERVPAAHKLGLHRGRLYPSARKHHQATPA